MKNLSVALLFGAAIMMSAYSVEAEASLATEISEKKKTTIASAATAYGAAWASRNLDRIMALHADETEFTSFLDGSHTARGKKAVRAAFAEILRQFPEYRSRAKALRVGGDFVVLEYDILSGPHGKFSLGKRQYESVSTDYAIPGVDVIMFDSEGKVTSKHSYVDALSILPNIRPLNGNKRK